MTGLATMGDASAETSEMQSRVSGVELQVVRLQRELIASLHGGSADTGLHVRFLTYVLFQYYMFVWLAVVLSLMCLSVCVSVCVGE